MLISIIIPTKNRANHLSRVLESLACEEYEQKEIIVCDGGSTDGTVELLRAKGSSVRWISEPDSGEYCARNRGLKMASGEVIKYLSDDDMLQSGALSFGAAYFKSHADVDILFNQAQWFYQEDDGKLTLYDTRPRTSASVELRNWVCGTAPHAASESAFFRRRVIERIGLFDTTLSFADADYWARSVVMGLRIEISDHVVVNHVKSRVSGVERLRLRGIREKWRLARKYGTVAMQVYVLLWRIPVQSAKWLFFLWVPPAFALALRKWLWRRRRWTAAATSAQLPAKESLLKDAG